MILVIAIIEGLLIVLLGFTIVFMAGRQFHIQEQAETAATRCSAMAKLMYVAGMEAIAFKAMEGEFDDIANETDAQKFQLAVTAKMSTN